MYDKSLKAMVIKKELTKMSTSQCTKINIDEVNMQRHLDQKLKQHLDSQTSFRKIVNAFPTYGTDSSGSNSLTWSTSASVFIGSNMTGPLPLIMSKGIFIPERGVKMSENKMTCQNN